MEDAELLDSVCELIAIADAGIADAIGALATDADHDAVAATLDVCLGNIETIAAVVEMAQADDVRRVCATLGAHLHSLNGDAARYFQEYGPRLAAWGSAVSAYLRRPDAPELAEALLGPLPDGLRADLPFAITAEPGNADLDYAAADKDFATEIVSALEPKAPEPDISQPVDAAPVGPEFDAAQVSSADEVVPEPAALVMEEEAAEPPAPAATAIVVPDPEPAEPQAPMVAESGITLVEPLLENENMMEASDFASDAPAHQDEAAADISESFRPFHELFAESSAWLEILAAPSASETELARAVTGYTDIIHRVQVLSEAIDSPSLDALCTQLACNIRAFAELDVNARLAACAVLEIWPAVVSAHLDDPADEANCLAVITHLSQSAWPHPMTEEQAAAWVALLAPNADNSLTDVETRPGTAQPDDVTLALADDVNPKLITVFLQESPANAAHLTDCIGRIGRGEEVVKNLGIAQRLAHNIKGSANLIGVKGVANLTHHLEDILEHLSDHRLAPPPPLAHTLQEGADCIEAMLEALQGLTAPPSDAQRILQDIYDWANRMDAGRLEAQTEALEHAPPSDPAPAAPEAHFASVEAESAPMNGDAFPRVVEAEHTASVAPAAAAAPMEAMLRIPAATFDALFRLVGEFSIAVDQLQERFRAVQRQSNELRHQDDRVQQRRFELEHCVDVRHVAATQQRLHRSGGRETFDPLEMDEYDEMYSATRSLTETVTDSRRMLLQLRGELAAVDHMFVQVQRMKRELQQAVMRTRMEPVGVLSARLLRIVRQACRTTDKHAELTLEGTETPLDSEVLNKLADPLMHMLRNAVDHGIESSEQRIAAGKPTTGRIRMRFFQEGNNVVIECADDGCGLNYTRIWETAVKRGLTDINPADHPALARLLLMPGFSTRAVATQLSGRGVGLDVVHSAIRELKGAMEIGDNRPGGCRIRLRVPLNLMTHYCLVVEAAGRQYAIPAGTVDRALSLKVGRFSAVGSTVAYELDQRIYPAYSLAACLQIARAGDDAFDAQKAALLVHSDAGLIALAIDRVLDGHHLVVRGLGRRVKTVHGVAGVTSLPDGRLIPVLDVPELLRAPSGTAAGVAETRSATPEPVMRNAPQVLIVDDSLSVRQSLADLMTELGYQPLLARDGVEAVELLRKQRPDIVLTDIEMPRMNGLELASYIRATHGAALPIVTITSRTMQKHRRLAQQAGVNLYLTKPFAEDQLLSGIRSLLH